MENNTKTTNKIKSFTDLKAWSEGHLLVLMIYQNVNNFPSTELFGLISQLKRASVSITSNIAEGFSRQTYADKVHFYTMALGSLTEVQNQLLIARDVKYLTNKQFQDIARQSVEVHKLINGLLKKSKTIRDS
ncbi:MAG: four helix bundle protein [Patescibacteria group bacterium]